MAARDDVLREQAHDAEHREPAVGDLHGELAALERLLERLAEVARAVVAVLVRELRLEDADEEEDLEEAHRRDLEQRLDAVRHVRELDVAAELDVAEGAELLGHDVADRRDHRDAAVLLLDVAVPLELLRADAVGDAPPTRA